MLVTSSAQPDTDTESPPGIISERLKISGGALGSGMSSCPPDQASMHVLRQGYELTVRDFLGGFATVFRAELDGNKIAVKVLLPQWCDPSDARSRAYQQASFDVVHSCVFLASLLTAPHLPQHFIKEGRFLAKMQHPWVPVGRGSDPRVTHACLHPLTRPSRYLGPIRLFPRSLYCTVPVPLNNIHLAARSHACMANVKILNEGSMHMPYLRNIVSCCGIMQLPVDHPGLPKGYQHPAWGMALELCKVRVRLRALMLMSSGGASSARHVP